MPPAAAKRVSMACGLAVIAFASSVSAGQYTIEPCLLLDGKQPALALRRAHAPADTLRDEAKSLGRESRAADQEVAAFNTKCDADFDEGSPEDLDCAAHRPPVAKRLGAERAAATAFNDKVRQLLSDTEQRLRTRIDTTRAQLARTSRDARRWQADAEEWLALADNAREAARERALDTTIDLTLEGIHAAAHVQTQLSEGELRRMRDWYDREGQAFPPDVRRPLEDAVRRARTTGDVEAMLTHIYRQHGTAYTWIKAAQGSTPPSEAVLALITSLPAFAHLDPRARMAFTVARLLDDTAYGWLAHAIAQGQVAELTRLEESEFAAVNRLAASYVADVDDLNAIVRAKSTCAI